LQQTFDIFIMDQHAKFIYETGVKFEINPRRFIS
jgi:hypothetical protein